MTMRYMICYDIAHDAKRERARKTLSEYGDHIQYSLFECYLSEGDVDALKNRLEELIDDRTDSVRFYPLCSGCVNRVIVEGGNAPEPDEGFVVI